MSKIIIIGANHAGTACANTILDLCKENEVLIFDRNSNISYLGCGTALWVGRQIESTEGLFYNSKEKFEARGAKIHMECEVNRIDFKAKKVFAKHKDGKMIEENYDKLIVATGSLPIEPKIKGMDLDNICFVKLFQDGKLIDEKLNNPEIKNVAIIGAGYIGVEIAEAVKRRGKNSMLFEAADTCLSGYYDPLFTNEMDNVLKNNGIELHYGEMVKEIKGNSKVQNLQTDKGEYQIDLVIMAIGFVPNNLIGKNEIELGVNNAFKVNLKQETSIKDVYAIGDCATIHSNALENEAYIALATNAVRSGIVAAYNVCGINLESIGVQGSNGICIFGYNMVSTGLNLKACENAGFEVLHTDFCDLQKPEFIRENSEVKIRIIYDKNSRRIVGAQVASFENISMLIHMFSLAIEEKVTIDKLKLLDIFFLPHFNKPYNYITMAALSAK